MKHEVVIFQSNPGFAYECYRDPDWYDRCGRDSAPTKAAIRELAYLHATGHDDVEVNDLTRRLTIWQRIRGWWRR